MTQNPLFPPPAPIRYNVGRSTPQMLADAAEQAARCAAPEAMIADLVRLAALAKDAPTEFLRVAKARQAALTTAGNLAP